MSSGRDAEPLWERTSQTHESALTNTQRCDEGATRGELERASIWASEGRAGHLEWGIRRWLAAMPDFRNGKEAQRRVQGSMLDLSSDSSGAAPSAHDRNMRDHGAHCSR